MKATQTTTVPDADGPALSPTEALLLDAAANLFAAKGFAAVGIREIAREAGLTIGALYHYAGSKEELFMKLMRRSYSRSTFLAEQAAATGASPTERVTNLVRAHTAGEIEDRIVWRLNLSELANLTPGARAELIGLRDKFEQVWRRVITEGINEGAFSPEDPSVARFSIIQMCNGVAVWYRPDGRLSLEMISDIVARQVLAVLNPR
jgi:AcrR family transcriptional regulator